jgi:hypothetical protein
VKVVRRPDPGRHPEPLQWQSTSSETECARNFGLALDVGSAAGVAQHGSPRLTARCRGADLPAPETPLGFVARATR